MSSPWTDPIPDDYKLDSDVMRLVKDTLDVLTKVAAHKATAEAMLHPETRLLCLKEPYGKR